MRVSRLLSLLLVAAGAACSGGHRGSDTSTVPETGGGSSMASGAAADGVVARWGVETLWGGERIEISADGSVLYVVLVGAAGRGQPDQEYRGTVTADDLVRLRRTFEEHDLCELRSGRDGIPDEGFPSLTVAFPGLACTVALWDGEWLEGDDARPCQELLHELARRFLPAASP